MAVKYVQKIAKINLLHMMFFKIVRMNIWQQTQAFWMIKMSIQSISRPDDQIATQQC